MLLMEIAHPTGSLDNCDRDQLSGAFLDLFLGAPGYTEEILRRVRPTTHIAFRELQGWRSGDGPPREGTAPPMLVTVTLPQAWQEESAAFLIGLVRTAVRRLDDDRGWVRPRGSLWIKVEGVPDGSIGLDGRPATASDVLAFLTEETRAARENGTAAPVPEGRLPDPVCGMTVADGKGALVVEYRGERLGFCSRVCRDTYVGEHPGAVV
ncbi:YHS domain-containing protein [Nocardiopsis sp. HNM0947]|uniref:YHS domain-containing protein n=1 Tax=Nocardiopsis coralli TaxID=2772213 RepID=A0ABR9PBX7_9ACTN|nr:YHS domain-containing protein [Nocardiopsis coralli]MBE3001338.1 YHS domain-containing protein [Nocardiopsis coralli]